MDEKEMLGWWEWNDWTSTGRRIFIDIPFLSLYILRSEFHLLCTNNKAGRRLISSHSLKDRYFNCTRGKAPAGR